MDSAPLVWRRGEYIQHMTNVGYEAWRRAKHKLLEYMANSNQTDEKSDSAQSSKETKPDFQEDLRRVFQLFDTVGATTGLRQSISTSTTALIHHTIPVISNLHPTTCD
jgi:hypothetical protein